MKGLKLKQLDREPWGTILVYLGLALLVMLPLLRPGYFFATDMYFVPRLPMPEVVAPNYLFTMLLHVLNIFIPAQVIQKLLFVLILFGLGYGMHRFMAKVLPSKNKGWNMACYFAGVLYMVNPFVYGRFMTGQYFVLLGCMLLPFFARAVWELCEQPGRRQALKVAAVATILAIVSIHSVGFAAMLGLAIVAVHTWPNRRNKKWLTGLAKWAAVAGVVTIVASSYWLLPVLKGSSETAAAIHNFSAADREAYATHPQGLGLLGNVASLRGFWAEDKNLFLLPSDIFSVWIVPILLLWALVGIGMVYAWRRQRRVCVAFGVLAVLAGILAVGTAGTVFAPLNQALVRYVPFFAGYREPQKFVMLILFAYAYYGGMGVYWLQATVTRYKKAVWGTLLIPLLCTPLLPWGGAGQLHARDYPADWYMVNKLLTSESEQSAAKALFLPWHLYMPFGFTGGVTTATPAPQFFDLPIVASQNPELGPLRGHYTDPAAAAADRLLANDPANNLILARELAAHNIGYIILAKELDYADYAYLEAVPGIIPYMDTPTLKVYRITEGLPQP